MMVVLTRFDLRQWFAFTGVAILMFCSSVGMAQDETASASGNSPINFGVKAGLNINTFDNAQPHVGASLGVTAGIFAGYSLSEALSLQLEASYFQQGGTLTKFVNDSRFGSPDNFFTHNVTTSKITLHNLEIPLLVKLNVPIEGSVAPSIYLGPSMAINFTAVDKYERTGEKPGGIYITTSGKERVGGYEKIQFGATAGLGLSLPMGSYKLLVDARYRYGITPAKKSFSYIDYTRVSTDLRVNTFSLTLGLGF